MKYMGQGFQEWTKKNSFQSDFKYVVCIKGTLKQI